MQSSNMPATVGPLRSELFPPHSDRWRTNHSTVTLVCVLFRRGQRHLWSDSGGVCVGGLSVHECSRCKTTLLCVHDVKKNGSLHVLSFIVDPVPSLALTPTSPVIHVHCSSSNQILFTLPMNHIITHKMITSLKNQFLLTVKVGWPTVSALAWKLSSSWQTAINIDSITACSHHHRSEATVLLQGKLFITLLLSGNTDALPIL